MTSKYFIFPCSMTSKIPSFYEKSGPSISGMCFLFPFLPSFIIIQEMLDEKVLDEESCGGGRLSREDRKTDRAGVGGGLIDQEEGPCV